MTIIDFVRICALGFVVACGPTATRNEVCNGVSTDTTSDPSNCGQCGTQCPGTACSNGTCGDSCTPGETAACYDGAPGTQGVGPCVGGTKTCESTGTWGLCMGEVVPVAEVCADHIDNDCNGMVDEDVDADGDGFTTCGGDCCDNASVCGSPKLVNPGAFEVAGNQVDDDCDGVVDEAAAGAACDTGLMSNSSNAMDAAKAMELCQTTTMTDKTWGVISATWTLADGTSVPNALSRAIRPHYGTGTTPKAGANMVLISTGNAAGTGDTNPGPDSGESGVMNTSSPFPADFYAANGNKLPNAPGCPAPNGTTANDPVMLNLTIRVPTNASSFTLQTNFFSSEFPEWTCSPFNDFFVVLLDSSFSGTPANPHDKNLATYTAPNMTIYPVGVNLAYGNTGLFTQCVNGPTGCEATSMGGVAGSITTCSGTGDLAGTGMEVADPLASISGCTGAQTGGATGWLTTSGNVVGGEIIKLRIAIWDTSDHALDSLAVIDNFKWSVEASDPGTVIQ